MIYVSYQAKEENVVSKYFKNWLYQGDNFIRSVLLFNIISVVLITGMWLVTTNNYKSTIAEQKVSIVTLTHELQKRQDKIEDGPVRKSTIISCANNQKDYLKTLRNTEVKWKMPKGILTQVAYVESNFDAKAVSHKGAVGIMQIVPRWHPEVNARDPYDAIPYSAKYLTYLKKRFGSWELALAAWNWGEGNMSKYSFYDAPRETKNFVRKVMQKVEV